MSNWAISKKKKELTKGEKVLLPLVTLAIFLGFWQIIATAISDPWKLPEPLMVAKAIKDLFMTGMFFEHMAISLYRFFSAYILAITFAIPCGLILGWYTRARQAFDPFIQILRPISPIAWMPFAVWWFGVGNGPAIFIIFLSAFFPILLSTVSAVRNVDPVYLKVAQNFGAKEKDVLLKVVIPAAFPYITIGLHIALGTAWIHLVAGEMVGAQSGLGYLIVDARNFLRTELIVAGMLIIGVLGLMIDRLMGITEKWIKKSWGLASETNG